MGRQSFSRFLLASAAVAGVSLIGSSTARAVGINDYQLTRTFTLPAAVPTSFGDGTVLLDALADGRLLAVNGTNVLRETAVGSGAFTSLGAIGGNFSAPFGATFLTVSPDGTRAAVGNNGGSVTVFNTATPATATRYAVADSDGVWADNTRVAVSNSNGVQVLDTTSGVVKTVIGNIGGYSAGVAFDAAGNIYTGNGGDIAAGGSDTGYVKGFKHAAFEAALTSNAPLDFENGGAVVADLLTASSLGFDKSGNLFVGGGELFTPNGDAGYAALVNGAVVQQALAAGATAPGVTASSPASVLRKFASPQMTIDMQQPPIFGYNDFTGELYLRYFQGNSVSVYTAVPEPTAFAGLLLAGVASLRRRRKAVAAVAAVAFAAKASTAPAYDASDFAVAVVASSGVTGNALYTDPAAILGRPTLAFNNGTTANPDYHRAKLIEGAFGTGTSGEKLITTFNAGASVTVRMGHAVTNDPSHPYGIDFNVFGNSFFTPSNTGGFTGDDTNLNTTTLSGIFADRVQVSVSPDNVSWYSYAADDAHSGDTYFPTNSYRWDRASAMWSNDLLDPTKAVDPALRASLTGKTGADALDLYNGSAGGAGFDLAESGFASILYVRFDGLTNFNGGEVDAVAAVPEPAMLGLASVAAVGALRRNRR